MTAAYLHGAALADSRQTRFTVSVTVPLRTDLVILEEPNPLMLSATDVTRGYKVVSARYRVMCTSQSGYLLQLIPRVGLAHSIDIAGLAQTVTVRDETVEVWRRPDAGADEFVLRLRLDLESAARPGHYLMPLFVTAVPL